MIPVSHSPDSHFKSYTKAPSETNPMVRIARQIHKVTTQLPITGLKVLTDKYLKKGYLQLKWAQSSPRSDFLDLKWAPKKEVPPVPILKPKVKRCSDPVQPKTARTHRSRFSLTGCGPLGAGSYGIVFPVEDCLNPGGSLVVKMNHRAEKKRDVNWEKLRFADWADVPHAMRLKTSYNDNETVSLVMPRIGMDLDDRVNAIGPLSLKETVLLLRQFFEMYAVTSKKGLVHGDIKGNNFAFNNYKLMVFDFGSSHFIKEPPKDTNFGAKAFRAPELLLNNPTYDCSIDLWSIGCSVYIAICGKSLFGTIHNDTPDHIYLTRIVEELGPVPASYKAKGFPGNPVLPANGKVDHWRSKILTICQKSGVSGQATNLFIELLDGMLCYENRISAERGLELCNQIAPLL